MTVLALVGATLALAPLWRVNAPVNAQDRRKFDPDEWREYRVNEQGHCTRYEMVGDLVRRYGLVGMTRSKIESLLGPPDSDPWSDLFPWSGWDLGHVRDGYNFFPDSTALIIEFGPDGRALKIH